MKIINSKYFQKWYNTVDDALKEKAFNIISQLPPPDKSGRGLSN